MLRMLNIATAVIAVLALLLTQDFSQHMALFDIWSKLFAALAIANMVLALFARKRNVEQELD